MKVLKFFVMALTAVLFCTHFTSCSSDEGDNWEENNMSFYDVVVDGMAFTIDSEGAYLQQVNPALSGHLNIPEEVYYEGTQSSYAVKAISIYVCERITSIKIPKCVTWVDICGLNSLKNVEIPDGVKDISITDCASLKNIELPNGVKSIVIKECPLMTSVNIPNGVTRVVIDYCTNLMAVNFPNGVERIELYECSSLTSVNIPNSATSVSIYGCTMIKNIELPDGVEYINFSGCTSLTSVNIPKKVRSLGTVFKDCKSLSTITIPDNVKEIGLGAFVGCEKLSSVHCLGTTPPKPKTYDSGSHLYSTYFEVTDILYVPKGCLEIYKTTYPWGEFKKIVEE